MHFRVKLAVAVAVTGAMAVAGTAAVAGGGSKQLEDVAARAMRRCRVVSTTGSGTFRATVAPSGDGFAYRLSYSGLEGNVTQAHIHLGQPVGERRDQRVLLLEPRQRPRRHPGLPAVARDGHGNDRRG